MFQRVIQRLKTFFFPPPDTPRFRRVLPYAVLGVLTLVLLATVTYSWEYTNSSSFCGTTCHTMPPEYASYQTSPHARVDCVECHIGRDVITTRISRKAGDLRHIFSLAFRTYEYPIRAHQLRPARDSCERCHYPEKFSGDRVREISHFASDEDNTRITTYLAMRTGGGSQREGLGRGIHWHVETEVWYVATDELEQDIPWIQSIAPDGTEKVYVSLTDELSEDELEELEPQRMDCITCHNRITHNIRTPEDAVDLALSRHRISQDIPYIRAQAVDALGGDYADNEEALEAIAALEDFYAETYPDYYAENEEEVQQAVDILQDIRLDIAFPEQKIDWETHPDNLGHKDWPGCWRCHDGEHVSEEDGSVIRMECNVCHSIPEVVGEQEREPVLPLATGQQPESHLSSTWIHVHRTQFDDTCSACHDVENPGGTDDSSFCSNSACHGTSWTFAALDAPGLAEVLAVPIVTPEPVLEPVGPGGPTYEDNILPLFEGKCSGCHGTVETAGLSLISYEAAMRGSQNGAVIVPGSPDDSDLVIRQQEGNHFGQFSDEELELVIEWIDSGAPE
jgi:nitrate/TMAO reductase-like tetraheme cytochrome c subunit